MIEFFYQIKYFGAPVYDGFRTELFCSKCKHTGAFSEWKGHKYFWLGSLPIIEIGYEKNLLMCERCEALYDNLIEEKEKRAAWEETAKEMRQYLEEVEKQFKCPRCEERFGIDTNKNEESITCKKCGNEIIVYYGYR